MGLALLNLALQGPEGDIRDGGNVNSHYDDPHAATGQCDFVLANPPFNVNAVDKDPLKDMVGAGRRFPFGLPRTDGEYNGRRRCTSAGREATLPRADTLTEHQTVTQVRGQTHKASSARSPNQGVGIHDLGRSISYEDTLDSACRSSTTPLYSLVRIARRAGVGARCVMPASLNRGAWR